MAKGMIRSISQFVKEVAPFATSSTCLVCFIIVVICGEMTGPWVGAGAGAPFSQALAQVSLVLSLCSTPPAPFSCLILHVVISNFLIVSI